MRTRTYRSSGWRMTVMEEMVNHPSHYTAGSVECIDALRSALGLRGFVDHCRACAIKYAWCSPHKGREAEDLRKAAWYLGRAAGELDRGDGDGVS